MHSIPPWGSGGISASSNSMFLVRYSIFFIGRPGGLSANSHLVRVVFGIATAVSSPESFRDQPCCVGQKSPHTAARYRFNPCRTLPASIVFVIMHVRIWYNPRHNPYGIDWGKCSYRVAIETESLLGFKGIAPKEQENTVGISSK